MRANVVLHGEGAGRGSERIGTRSETVTTTVFRSGSIGFLEGNGVATDTTDCVAVGAVGDCGPGTSVDEGEGDDGHEEVVHPEMSTTTITTTPKRLISKSRLAKKVPLGPGLHVESTGCAASRLASCSPVVPLLGGCSTSGSGTTSSVSDAVVDARHGSRWRLRPSLGNWKVVDGPDDVGARC